MSTQAPPTPRRVAVAFGSNLGDRRGTILRAAHDVGLLLSAFVLSPIIETAPVGPGLDHDPSYLNAVGVGYSAESSRSLLEAMRGIENRSGRTRSRAGAPRTLDLDLILAGDELVDEPDLQLPHPRFRERQFVLEPLAAVAPDLHDPVTGRSVGELWERLRQGRQD